MLLFPYLNYQHSWWSLKRLMFGTKIIMIHQKRSKLQFWKSNQTISLCNMFFTLKGKKQRYFIIPSAVAVFKHDVLATSFCEKNIPLINIQFLTLNSKHSFNDQATIAFLPHWLKTIFPTFQFFSKRFQKSQAIHSQIVCKHDLSHWKFQKILLLKTESHEALFVEMPQTHFLSTLKRHFPFMETFLKKLKIRTQYQSKKIQCICLPFQPEY